MSVCLIQLMSLGDDSLLVVKLHW